MNRKTLSGVTALALLMVFGVGQTHARELTFEDRVRAQEAIERIYYGHQVGGNEPFEAAVPSSVVEGKVRLYLKRTAALERFWGVRITRRMLHRELERMAAGTRMPERLVQLFAALDNDPLLVEECLARPALAERLVRSFYNGVSSAAPARTAESLDPGTAASRDAMIAETADPMVAESANGRAADERRESWWRDVEKDIAIEDPLLDDADEPPMPLPQVSASTAGGGFVTVAQTVPASRSGHEAISDPAAGCTLVERWAHNSLSDQPHGRTGNTAVWTGTHMILWGGAISTDYGDTASGLRYDPATETWSPTSLVDAPSRRHGHTAVWTGSLMIVWGGSDVGGGRYDPLRDVWMPISVTGSPAVREGHSTVWTGRRMIVWGVSQAIWRNMGASYNPVTDRWKGISIKKAPEPRQEQSAVWTGKAMIVWGGELGTNLPKDTGGRYYPSTNTWKALSEENAPEGRYRHAAVWTGREMIVWGGFAYSGALRTGALYNPSSNTWRPMAMDAAPEARGGQTAIWTGSSMIVWGGLAAGSLYPWYPVPVSSGARYDPVANTWSPVSQEQAPAPRFQHTAVWTGAQMIVWGGDQVRGGRYDPSVDRWTPTAPSEPPSPRAGHSVVWTGNLMIVWGGLDSFNGGDTGTNTGARYDPATDTWTPTSTEGAPSDRRLHTAVWTGREMIVWGGSWNSTGGRYDPIVDAWRPTSLADAPSARSLHTAVWTGSSMIVWGGTGIAYGSEFNTGGRYDPTNDSWNDMTLLDAPSGRLGHSAVWTGSSMIVWGGVSLYGLHDDGARYDPEMNGWSPIQNNGRPSPRFNHLAVWTGDRMILWGGWDGEQWLRSGAQYDPANDTWRPTSMLGAPTARTGASAVWTGEDWIVWGGSTASHWSMPPFLGSGARYAPSTDAWTAITSQEAPSSRAGHSAVWTGDSMIVWGGIEGDRFLTTSGGTYDARVCCDADQDGTPDCTAAAARSDRDLGSSQSLHGAMFPVRCQSHGSPGMRAITNP